MARSLRVIEIGATNIRKSDVDIAENININDLDVAASEKILESPSALLDFATKDLGNQDMAFAVAGPVLNHQIIELLPNVPDWPRNFNLANYISAKTNTNVKVFNDMEAAVVGMNYLLKRQNDFKGSFWGITWSSGIGGRYFSGEKIGPPSEIGHLVLDITKDAPMCGCGKRGHAEAILSGSALAKEINKNLPELTKAYANDESWARDFYQAKARLMGVFLANLLQINPAELVCFKGSVAVNLLKFEDIKKTIIQAILDNVISNQWSPKEIILSPDPEKDTFYGIAEMMEIE